MNLDAGAVDDEPIRRVLCAGQGGKDGLPDAALGPANEAIVECLLRPIDRRTIGPASPRLQRLNDTAQHASVIDPLLAACVGWQQGRDPSPLRIGKPEKLGHITTSLPKAVNHAGAAVGIPLMGPDPRAVLNRNHSSGTILRLRDKPDNSPPIPLPGYAGSTAGLQRCPVGNVGSNKIFDADPPLPCRR